VAHQDGRKIDTRTARGRYRLTVWTACKALLGTDAFVQTMAEKLLMYGPDARRTTTICRRPRSYARRRKERLSIFGAGYGYSDQPAVPDESEEGRGGPLMFITKKHLSRRTFIRGAGVTRLSFLNLVPRRHR
jgi:hypothetical protein